MVDRVLIKGRDERLGIYKVEKKQKKRFAKWKLGYIENICFIQYIKMYIQDEK